MHRISLLDFFSAFAGGPLLLIFPAMYFLRMSKEFYVHKWEKVAAYFAIALGIVVFAGGSIAALYDLLGWTEGYVFTKTREYALERI